MTTIVLLIGLASIAFAAAAASRPEATMRSLGLLFEGRRIWLALACRLVLGGFLIGAAELTRLPTAVLVLGVLVMSPVVLLPFVGVDRVRKLVGGLPGHGPAVGRAWAVALAAFGAVLVVAGL